MNTVTTKKSVIICALALSILIPTVAICDDSGGSKITKVIIKSDNTVVGKVTAKDNSHISIGDTQVSKVTADTVDIYSKNNAGAIIAKDHSIVSMGRVEVSNLDGGTVDIDTINKVGGKITAKKHSTVTMGTVKVQ